VNGEHFALIAGAGFDAEVMADATTELKSRLGFAAYLYSGLKHVITAKQAEFRIVADGEELEIQAAMVLVANVGQLGAGPLPVELRVAPRVSFQDGLLDVCVYAPRNIPELARVLWKVARHQYGGDERMIFFQARRVRVEAEPPVAAQVDGEPHGETPIEAEVDPLAGRILVPA
jgi:diacylglycerol kinase family enzyme